MGKSAKADPANFSDAYVQALKVSHEATESSRCALLQVGDDKLAFNCGEGFQRCCNESQVRVTRLRGIFLTHVCFASCSGLPGSVITCAEAARTGGSSLTVAGPPKLGLFMNALAAYSDYVLRELKLDVKELRSDAEPQSLHLRLPEPVYSTTRVKVYAILLRKTGVSDTEHTPATKRRRVEDGKEGATAEQDPGHAPQPVPPAAVCLYVCLLPTKRGKFLPQTATALGVPKGPAFGKLTKGESVVTPAGDVVTPEMCMEGEQLGEVVVVVDCPEPAYIPGLQSATDSITKLIDDAAGQRMKAFVHLTGAPIAREEAYQHWILQFDTCQHLMLGEPFDAAVDAPSLVDAHKFQAKLHMLCPTVFPLPDVFSPQASQADLLQSRPEEVPSSDTSGAKDGISARTPVTPNEGGTRSVKHLEKLVLRPLPLRGYDYSDVRRPISIRKVMSELQQQAPRAVQLAIGALQRSIAQAVRWPLYESGSWFADTLKSRENGCEEQPSSSSTDDTFNIIFLGTGASCPSKYRNVTSIYLDFGPRGGMLVDCGEGTLGQLQRHFGIAGARARIQALHCIWISHRHADHHVGLPAVLAERVRLLPADAERITVFGPFSLRRVLSALNRMQDLRYQWIDQYCICPREQGAGRDLDFFWDNVKAFDPSPYVQSVCNLLGLEDIQSVLVQHCKHAFGLVLRSKAGWKFVFSGDTEKCDNLITAAKDATILVHEATFENDKVEDAKHKKHSTIADALEVGKLSLCKSLLLTHFSQRYPKIPNLEDVRAGVTGVAFDMMTIAIGQADAPHSVLPVLQELFDSSPVGETDVC